MQTDEQETPEQEKARLIEEIIAHEDIGYPPGSPHTESHRRSLSATPLAHLRALIKIHTETADGDKTLTQ